MSYFDFLAARVQLEFDSSAILPKQWVLSNLSSLVIGQRIHRQSWPRVENNTPCSSELVGSLQSSDKPLRPSNYKHGICEVFSLIACYDRWQTFPSKVFFTGWVLLCPTSPPILVLCTRVGRRPGTLSSDARAGKSSKHIHSSSAWGREWTV